MASFIAFPSIEKFSNVVKDIKYDCRESGDELPTLTFKGTTKLHGTNAAIGYNVSDKTIWAQSRNLILEEGKPDNCGFREFVKKMSLVEIFHQWHNDIIQHDNMKKNDTDIETILVFGEFAGQGIQKNVALEQLPKMFVIFDVLVTFTDKNQQWVPETLIQKMKSPVHKIYNVYDYETWTIQIDFNQPDLVTRQLETITDAVEKCCPVGHGFGVVGTGEGVVWKARDEKLDKVYRFKVKGSEHCSTKLKTGEKVSTDVEKVENIQAFVDYAVTESRLQQGLHQLFHAQDQAPSMKSVKVFLDWVKNDVLKEESDTLKESGLDEKSVVQAITQHARQWFMKQI